MIPMHDIRFFFSYTTAVPDSLYIGLKSDRLKREFLAYNARVYSLNMQCVYICIYICMLKKNCIRSSHRGFVLIFGRPFRFLSKLAVASRSKEKGGLYMPIVIRSFVKRAYITASAFLSGKTYLFYIFDIF